MNKKSAPVAALVLGLLVLPLSRAFCQGSLTPPGPPAGNMKSLDQIEPRVVVNAANTPGNASNTFIISAPGSYYLTGNIAATPGKHGISVQADDVTIDLNGFALSAGDASAVRGINVPAAQKNLCVRNGTVRGWSDGGIRAESVANTFAEKLRLSDNITGFGLAFGSGTARDCVATGNLTGFFVSNGGEIRDSAATANTTTGFFAGDRTMLSNCIATVNSGDGFTTTSYVTIIDCTASRNFGNGIVTASSSSVIRCNASRNIPSGTGIVAGAGCTVADCTAGNNGVHGIKVDFGSTVRACTAQVNVDRGIVASASCQLTANTCDSNKIGIEVTGDNNRLDGNICTVSPGQNGTSGYQGFYIRGANNWVVRNTARGSFAGTVLDQGFVFDVPANNAYGQIQRTSGGEISTTSPWANFRH